MIWRGVEGAAKRLYLIGGFSGFSGAISPNRRFFAPASTRPVRERGGAGVGDPCGLRLAWAMAQTTIEIRKEALHFAAAHFTIFSATERENLHGHNFRVAAHIDAEVGADGLAFDYNVVKSRLQALCDGLDERTLLPERSPHLTIAGEEGYTVAHFNGERIPFLPRDVLTLPVANITIEALAEWLGGELMRDREIAALHLHRLTIKVSSGPGQWAQASFAPGDAGSRTDQQSAGRRPAKRYRRGIR